jgi:hypothetical protein
MFRRAEHDRLEKDFSDALYDPHGGCVYIAQATVA